MSIRCEYCKISCQLFGLLGCINKHCCTMLCKFKHVSTYGETIRPSQPIKSSIRNLSTNWRPPILVTDWVTNKAMTRDAFASKKLKFLVGRSFFLFLRNNVLKNNLYKFLFDYNLELVKDELTMNFPFLNIWVFLYIFSGLWGYFTESFGKTFLPPLYFKLSNLILLQCYGVKM